MLTVLSTFPELMVFLALVIVGLIAIILVKAVIQLVVPIVAAAVVWLMTSNLTYAGIAFLAVAILQLVLKRK